MTNVFSFNLCKNLPYILQATKQLVGYFPEELPPTLFVHNILISSVTLLKAQMNFTDG